MTGSSSGPLGGTRHEPPGGHRLPDWMRREDEIGTMVLLLRRKSNNEDKEEETAKDGLPEETNSNRKPDPALPNPFIVGASIELAIGVREARTVIASREGRGSRYLLRTASKQIFEKLMKITELTDKTQVEIIPHPSLNTVQGTVYDPDSINVDEKEILNYLSSQGVQAVRRIKKRVNGDLQNTPLLVLTFQGTVLPKYVYFGVLRIPVRTYYPSPMICFNCSAYGHPGRSCQNSGICLQCSKSHNLANGEKCNNPPHCLHCMNGHAVTSRDCPKYQSEVNVIRIKVDQGISFPEARRIYSVEMKKKTVANVVQDRLNNELAVKDQLIATLQKQVAELAKELAALKNALKSKNSSEAPASQNPRASTSQTSSSQNSSSSAKSGSSSQNKDARMSRKDKSLNLPPTQKKDYIDPNRYELRNRSKSCKRHMETSPTDDNNQANNKRILTQPSDDPIDFE